MSIFATPRLPPVVEPLNPPPPPAALPPPAEDEPGVGAEVRQASQRLFQLGRRRTLLTPGGARGDVTLAPGQRKALLGT